MFGAGAATADELFAQGCTGAMGAYGGVGRGDVLRDGIGIESSLLQIYFAQQLCIGRRDDVERTGDALARGLLQLRIGCRRGFQFLCPTFKGCAFGGAAPIVVDDGVAEDAIEPGNGGLAGAQASPRLGDLGLKGTQVGCLQNIFGDGATVDSALEEG